MQAAVQYLNRENSAGFHAQAHVCVCVVRECHEKQRVTYQSQWEPSQEERDPLLIKQVEFVFG